MEIQQKVRSNKNASWEATFPNEPVGEKSRSFLQRVVFIAASHILYCRQLLPAKYFKKRQIEKVKFYVVRAEGEGEDIVHSLKGVMEAIEFAYLRDFIIMIADRDRKDEYEALEVHRMSFFYESEEAQMIITCAKGKKIAIKYTGVKQARRQFFHLIRRISAYGNIMGALPQNICTIFKLTYYDEKTPPNYEPQGFMADEDLFHFPKEVEPLTLGRFDCEKHMVATSVHSIFMKNASDIKSLMNAGAPEFNTSLSHSTTVCSSPIKTLRTLSTRTDEFSQEHDIEQQSNLMNTDELAMSNLVSNISDTLNADICRTVSDELSISMESLQTSVKSDFDENQTEATETSADKDL